MSTTPLMETPRLSCLASSRVDFDQPMPFANTGEGGSEIGGGFRGRNGRQRKDLHKPYFHNQDYGDTSLMSCSLPELEDVAPRAEASVGQNVPAASPFAISLMKSGRTAAQRVHTGVESNCKMQLRSPGAHRRSSSPPALPIL